MRIAIYTDTFLPQVNGVVNVITWLAKEFVKQGHEVMIFTVKAGVKPKLKGVKIHRFKSLTMPSYKEHRIAIPGPVKHLKKVKEFNPDIIHIHTPFWVGWEGLLAAWLLHKPVVGTHHTFLTEYLKYIKVDKEFMRVLVDKYTGVFYNRCDAVTSSSKALADAMKKGGCKKRILVMPNAINTEKFKPQRVNSLKKKLGLSDKTLVYVGRIGYEKSINVLLRALRIIVKQDKEVKLLIVGDGPYMKELKSKSRKLGVTKNVVFTGLLTDNKVVDAINCGQIFATASTTENMPMTIIEAMSCGLPIIGVDAKGIPELVEQGKNGFLVKPRDYKAIANHVLELFNNKELIDKISCESMKMSEKYSVNTVAGEFLKLYKSLKK